MFKSKLQELCQRNSWNLPVYTSAKQGKDHNPHFQATVTVNDLSFTSQNLFKSSKEALIDAARVAFQHFSSPPSRPSHSGLSVASSCGSLSGSSAQLDAQETDQTTQVNVTISSVDDVHVSRDVEHLYKSQLQYYAQKRNLPLPMYSCEQEGPPHASRFKCKVTIDGQTYESLQFFPTVKEAEHEAAKIAFMSLSSDRFQQGDSVLYKNLLQELAQKEGNALPVYNTQQSGESHRPTFVSTVEVEGETFSGQEAKTKKLAETSAAKVAYMRLKECSGNPTPSMTFVSPANPAQSDYSSTSLHSNVTADLHNNVQPAGRLVVKPSFFPKEQPEESRGERFLESRNNICRYSNNDSLNPFELTAVNAEVCSNDFLDQFPQPEIIPKKRDSSSSGLTAPSTAENASSPSSFPSECSVNPIVDSSIGQSVGMDTSSSSNRIKVCPYVPNMKFPNGSFVLHRDNNWVALKLGSQSNR